MAGQKPSQEDFAKRIEKLEKVVLQLKSKVQSLEKSVQVLSSEKEDTYEERLAQAGPFSSEE